jgi:phage baseplate assembly protein W
MVEIVARKKDYSDLDLDFMPHPTTGDVMKKTGVDAIKRSVRNLILTNFYDRPFRSYIGSGALKLLYENANPITANFLNNAIREVVENYEPRVRVDNIIVKFDYDNNGYDATLFFTILNRNEPVVINLFLERIR